MLALPASRLAYGALFLIVGGESAGLFLPGETALIAGGVLASRGSLSLPLVLATAAAGAIVGDNVGYVAGRRGIRRLLTRPGRFARGRARFVEEGERFFARHGAKTVFLGRWLPGLRITAAWLAGTNRMPWWRFFLWNAAGGIAWACSVGLLAFALGQAAEEVVRIAGLTGLGLLLLAAFAVGVWQLRRRRR